ncbi:aldehyde dehydrogenase [Phyllobacterium endophyticum]|uniref:aldehyde dehydrogenase n=1 Tax=Phyllobacterium endophyticum TaxID=1149773 RepID=UPI0011C7E990|nr:aldehyde dehydrogenase [Phyllobacterium endophyticum]TXR47493.1 aldehyde dehydrogenase [Phyllobacterium endophyticum]
MNAITRPFMIANQWSTGEGEPFVSINPADGTESARIGVASKSDVDAAVRAARAAFDHPSWRALKQHQRAAFLYRMADLTAANKEVLARAQTADNGKSMNESRAQAASAADVFRYYGAVCESTESEITPQRGPSVTMTVYEPVGVVAAITPWNSPITIEAQKLAPIIAAGNTVVLKPSEVTSQVALEYARLYIEAGFPEGVVNIITGAGDVGRMLVDRPDIDMISFTGGTKAGQMIAESAGRRLIPVVLELGGKSPNIVFADADLKRAANVVADGIFSGSGQSCIAGSRIFVQREIFDGFLDSLVTASEIHFPQYPENPSAISGAMSSFHHRDLVAAFVDRAKLDGGRVVIGGEILRGGDYDKGAYYPPTIISDVTNQSRIAREEIFGPVAAIIPFVDEADAIAQANDTDFGLAAGVWTSDFAKAWRVGRALRAGTVWINGYKEGSISAPFGGFKRSGIGREKGVAGMRSYMQAKSMYWRIE